MLAGSALVFFVGWVPVALAVNWQ